MASQPPPSGMVDRLTGMYQWKTSCPAIESRAVLE
jgi:hypothetical protein